MGWGGGGGGRVPTDLVIGYLLNKDLLSCRAKVTFYRGLMTYKSRDRSTRRGLPLKLKQKRFFFTVSFRVMKSGLLESVERGGGQFPSPTNCGR